MTPRNIKGLEFHIEQDDYFGTLATILSLIRQTIEKDDFKEINIKNLQGAEENLLYLQNNYKIVKKYDK